MLTTPVLHMEVISPWILEVRNFFLVSATSGVPKQFSQEIPYESKVGDCYGKFSMLSHFNRASQCHESY